MQESRIFKANSFRSSSESGQLLASPQKAYLQFRRALDILLASLALLASLPILILACSAIALESPGAPIFTQRRIGAAGREFRMYKIRTMFANAEKAACVTTQADPRVTGIGRWLRLSKIDELPQLINIVLGDMSIIGSRPLSAAECNYIRRLGFSDEQRGFIPARPPGLIGLEQLNRYRNLSYEERFALNALYQKRAGWLLDLQILLRSIIQCRALVACVAMACIGELALLLGCFH